MGISAMGISAMGISAMGICQLREASRLLGVDTAAAAEVGELELVVGDQDVLGLRSARARSVGARRAHARARYGDDLAPTAGSPRGRASAP